MDTPNFTDNELVAGKCWLEQKFPNAILVDLVILKVRYDMPGHAEAYIRAKWFLDTTIKNPFNKSEIYSKTDSSSSLYIE